MSDLTLEERKAKKAEINQLIAEAREKIDAATKIADEVGLYFEARLFRGGPMKYAGMPRSRDVGWYDRLTEQFVLMDEFKTDGRIDWNRLEDAYPDGIQIEYPGWNSSSVGC